MKKVLILLANGFEEFETCALIDIFGHSKLYCEEINKIDFDTTAIQKEVRSLWNTKIIVDKLVDEVNVNEYEALIIPGGFDEGGYYNEMFNRKCQELIKQFYNENKYLIAICVGSIPMAKAGILTDRYATTYCSARRMEQLEEYGAILSNNKIVKDQNIITSNGPATAPDIAFLTVELLTSKQNANKIREMMCF